MSEPADTSDGAHGAKNGRIPVGEAIQSARRLIVDLLGKPAESVSGVSRSDDGWTVSLDIVELSRIPPSTDLLATYDVVVDHGGDLVDLVRSRRYMRNQADEE